MPLILNIETATEVCSVALSKENEIIDIRENVEGKSHASLLTVFIEDIFKNNSISAADLDAVAISIGPGSYTGLRIGVSTVKGLCYGSDKPVIAIPTLQSMAFGFSRDHNLGVKAESINAWLCPMIDARRLEVYTSFFDIHAIEKSETRAVILEEYSFEDILAMRKVFFFGNGSKKFDTLTKNKENAIFIDDYQASSRNMISLSEEFYQAKKFQDIAYFEPFYLKDFLATTPKNKVLQKT